MEYYFSFNKNKQTKILFLLHLFKVFFLSPIPPRDATRVTVVCVNLPLVLWNGLVARVDLRMQIYTVIHIFPANQEISTWCPQEHSCGHKWYSKASWNNNKITTKADEVQSQFLLHSTTVVIHNYSPQELGQRASKATSSLLYFYFFKSLSSWRDFNFKVQSEGNIKKGQT